MKKNKIIDEATEEVRQSIISQKGQKNNEQYCIRDYNSEVFELTDQMLVEERTFNIKEQSQQAGVAECILHKYDKILSQE